MLTERVAPRGPIYMARSDREDLATQDFSASGPPIHRVGDFEQAFLRPDDDLPVADHAQHQRTGA